jgi:hypothetical protein
MKLIPVFIVTLLAGCSSHYSAADVAGKYVLAVDGGTDTIELDGNGKYRHSYAAKSGYVGRQEDTWSLEELQAGTTVVLNNFRNLSGSDVRERGSYHMLLVKKSYGDLYLITNIDLNEGYRRGHS